MNDLRCFFVVYIVFKVGKEGDMGGGSEGGGVVWRDWVFLRWWEYLYIIVIFKEML